MKPVEVTVLASDPITHAGAVSLLEAHPDVRVTDLVPDVLLVMEDHVTEAVLGEIRAAKASHVVLVVEGFGTEEIAAKLCYSERTVKNVLYGLMTRVGLNNRAHAVAYALRAGAI